MLICSTTEAENEFVAREVFRFFTERDGDTSAGGFSINVKLTAGVEFSHLSAAVWTCSDRVTGHVTTD